MADQTLELLIKLAAELGAGQQTIDVLNKVKAAGGDVNDASIALTKSQVNLSDVEEKQVGITEKLEKNKRALHMVLHLIGREAGPEAAAALGLLASVMTGGVMLAVFALIEGFKALHEHFKAIREDALETGKAISEMWEKVSEEQSKALTDALEYKAALADVNSNVDALKTSEDAENVTLADNIKRRKEVIQAMEEAGLLPKGAGKQPQVEIDAMTAQAALLDKERYDRTRAAGGLGAAAGAAGDTFESQKARQDVEIARLQAIIKDAESRLPRYQAAVTTGIDPTTGKAADIDVARAGLINQQTNIQHAQAAIAELTAQMEEEKKVRDKAKAAYDANQAAITKLTEEYNKLVEQIQSAKGTAAITAGLSGTGGAFSAVEKAIQDARRGQGTAEDAGAIAALKDLLNNIGLNGAAIIQYLATSGNLHQSVLNEITVANRRIEQLAQQIAHSPPAPGP